MDITATLALHSRQRTHHSRMESGATLVVGSDLCISKYANRLGQPWGQGMGYRIGDVTTVFGQRCVSVIVLRT